MFLSAIRNSASVKKVIMAQEYQRSKRMFEGSDGGAIIAYTPPNGEMGLN